FGAALLVAAAGLGAAFSAAGFAGAAGLGVAGFAAAGPAAPGFARAAARISAMLIPLPPGENLPPAAVAGAAELSGASPATGAGSGLSSEDAGRATGAAEAAFPPLAFSARAAARISSTDIFLAIVTRP